MRKAILGLCFLLVANIGISQTIINAEQLIGGADSTIYSLTLSYNGTNGNSNTNQINIAPSIIFIRKNNDLMLFGGYSVLSESNNKILNTGFAHLRHRYFINERLKTFEFYQIQFNDVLLLNKRVVLGAGLNFEMIKSDSIKLNLSAGLMREVEILNETNLLPDEISETRYMRLSVVNGFKWLIGTKIKINNVIYYQPYLKDFADYRLLDDFSLSVSIARHFDIITSVTFRYDSQPPDFLGRIDNVVTIGVNVKF